MKHLSLIAASLIMSSTVMASSPYAVSFVEAKDVHGTANQEVLVSSLHTVSMTNPTNNVIGWHYIYSLCNQFGKCFEKKFTVNVQPHANFQDHGTIDTRAVFDKPAQYKFAASTKIIGDIKDFSDEKISYNTIHIK